MGIGTIGGTNPQELPLSEAVRAGDLIFVSDIVGFGPDGNIVASDIASETNRIIQELAVPLKKLGATLRNVVKVNVFLPSATNMSESNRVYAKHFSDLPPTRIGVVAEFTINAPWY